MSNSFIKSAIMKLFIILVSVFTVEKSIFGQEIFFEDSFNTNEIDTLKWNTSIATSGKRWCPTTWTNHNSAPGEWIDISKQEYRGFKQASPYGNILIKEGQISFSANIIRAFPYIWAGSPSRPSPFPNHGDFILEVRMKYSANLLAGNGIIALNWKNSDPIGNNPPLPTRQWSFMIWGDSHGLRVSTFDSVLVYIPDKISYHNYKLEYINGEYSLSVDGIPKRSGLKSSLRPNTIWIGNPVFTFASLNDWSDFTIDFIRVTALSTESPQLVSVTDVPHDQGGKVTLKWHASALDSNLTTLPFYSIWRALPERKPAVRRVSIKNITEDFQGPALRLETINGREYAWEWLANQPAHRLATYTYTAATLYDSMSTTDGKQYFMVSAHTSDPNVFYDSHVDSGYSVDNLTPLAPRNLVAEYTAAGVRLHWSPAPEADLRQYLLYRSHALNIDPELLTPFATSRDTVLLDATPLTSSTYYVVCAQDIHDNRSPKSDAVVVSVTNLHDAAGKFPPSFRLDQNHPNPFNASTTIPYEIPDARRVTLTIYDLLGKEIAALVQEQQAAGEYSVQWNAENLPSGIYVYRLVAGELVAIKKLILMK